MNDTTRTCGYFRAQLSALLDDELGRSEKLATEEHLASCPACTAEFRSLSAMTGELASLPRAAVGPEFLVELRKKLDAGVELESASWAEGLNWFRVNLTLGTAMTVAIGLVAFRSDTVREAARSPGAPAAVSDRAMLAEARVPQAEGQVSLVANTARKDADALAGAGPAPAKPEPPAVALAKLTAPAAESPAPAIAASAPPAAEQPGSAGGSAVSEADSLDGAQASEEAAAPEVEREAPRASEPEAPLVASKRAMASGKGGAKMDLAFRDANESKKEKAASPAAPMPSTGLARFAESSQGAAQPQPRRSQVARVREPAGASRALTQDMDALKQGLQVGDLSGGAAVDRFEGAGGGSRSEVLARPAADGGGLGETLHATPGRTTLTDDEQSAEKDAAAGSFDPSLTGDSQVTHALLSHYFGNKAVETPEQATRPRSEGSIVIKVTRLRAFLRALKAQVDTMSMADFQATSTSSFEFSVMVEGGQTGLEEVTARLSSFPGAQPAGLMFERLGDSGRFAARVMVTVAPE